MVRRQASQLSDSGCSLDAAESLDALRAARAAHEGPPLARILTRKGMGPYRAYGEMLAAMETLDVEVGQPR